MLGRVAPLGACNRRGAYGRLAHASLLQALLAERVARERADDSRAAIDRAYRYALGRSATTEEMEQALALSAEHGLEPLCWVLLNTSEFLYVR